LRPAVAAAPHERVAFALYHASNDPGTIRKAALVCIRSRPSPA